MHWLIKDNIINKLFINDENIINPWGFETADSSAFFSLEEGIGWRYNIVKREINYDNKKFAANIENQMKEGKWKLKIDDKIMDNHSIVRFVEAECLEDTIFMDFVMRFRFKKEFIDYAIIAEKKIKHNNSNIYYQYPVNNVFLKGSKFNVNVDILESKVPSAMKPVMYVRDNNGEWVVHVRMLPLRTDKEVIKICTKWAATRPLPQLISKNLLKFSRLRNFLWYRGEFSPINNNILLKLFNPSAFPMVKVKKGTKLMWKVRVEIK
ncbi:hypothetical protein BABA_15137 [Neobacillus bataviensis LMG 21833]|uniref:Uncharacterized protein n=1 Tax=Neobacillus bataviensis LMG 21833 TaxID=1117379 RepID=K6C5P8_9BACI|nr:hypothetical protein [Neobacillus bataviensis]EKN66455.1 hypothetical protein BABA_15137 [Neobacillus bataviensis LMG 21833]